MLARRNQAAGAGAWLAGARCAGTAFFPLSILMLTAHQADHICNAPSFVMMFCPHGWYINKAFQTDIMSASVRGGVQSKAPL